MERRVLRPSRHPGEAFLTPTGLHSLCLANAPAPLTTPFVCSVFSRGLKKALFAFLSALKGRRVVGVTEKEDASSHALSSTAAVSRTAPHGKGGLCETLPTSPQTRVFPLDRNKGFSVRSAEATPGSLDARFGGVQSEALLQQSFEYANSVKNIYNENDL